MHHAAFFSSCASPAHVVIVLTLGTPTNDACFLCRLTQTTLLPSQCTRHQGLADSCMYSSQLPQAHGPAASLQLGRALI